jgi:hypothetical protein
MKKQPLYAIMIILRNHNHILSRAVRIVNVLGEELSALQIPHCVYYFFANKCVFRLE